MKRIQGTATLLGIVRLIGAAGIVPVGYAAATAPQFIVEEIPPSAEESLRCDYSYYSITYARRMNDKGEAVGLTDCYVATGDSAAPYQRRGNRSFAWKASTGTFSLPPPPTLGEDSYARDINEFGMVVGQSASFEGIVTWQLGWGGDEIIDDATCRTGAMLESGINDAGAVAFSTYRYGIGGACQRSLVLRRLGGEEVAGPDGFRGYALNNDEIAVGVVAGAAAKWSPTRGLVVLSAQDVDKQKTAWNLNQVGDVVGFVTTSATDASACAFGTSDAMLWPASGGSIVLTKLSAYPLAQAYGINDSGSVVGYSMDAAACSKSENWRATLWQVGQAWDLNELIPNSLNVRLTVASSINSTGQILARGIRLDEPAKPCPQFDSDPVTGAQVYNASYMCRTEYAYLLTPGPRFADVPPDFWAYTFIERLAAAGITSGCDGGNYCPTSAVTRAQMAVFLERGMRGSDFRPPAAKGNVFSDVGAQEFAASFIEQLYLDGITAGCGANKYCPAGLISRAEMAVFLLRAKHGAGYRPPSATGLFSDVPLSHWAVHWIEQLAREGITGGCGGGKYCPSAVVTRDQMAVFLVRTFGL